MHMKKNSDCSKIQAIAIQPMLAPETVQKPCVELVLPLELQLHILQHWPMQKHQLQPANQRQRWRQLGLSSLMGKILVQFPAEQASQLRLQSLTAPKDAPARSQGRTRSHVTTFLPRLVAELVAGRGAVPGGGAPSMPEGLLVQEE